MKEPIDYEQWIKDNLCSQDQSAQMAAQEPTEPISAIFYKTVVFLEIKLFIARIFQNRSRSMKNLP